MIYKLVNENYFIDDITMNVIEKILNKYIYQNQSIISDYKKLHWHWLILRINYYSKELSITVAI